MKQKQHKKVKTEVFMILARQIKILGLLMSLAGGMGCDLINPAEGIPGFLYVEDMILETDPLTQGSASEKITEVWVTVDGEFLGAYSLPAMIPVLKEGEAQVVLNAGIKDNGVTATPEIYPFYEAWERTLTFQPEQVDTIRPVISYRGDARFAFIENFETSSHIFQDIRIGETVNRIRLTDSGVFEGDHSGLLQLDTANAIVEIATTNRYPNLNGNRPEVYLEVNYRSETPVIWGVVGYGGIGANGTVSVDPGFNPSAEWNKIYFNISALLFEGGFEEHQILLRAFLPVENGQFTRNSARVWLDNVKLVHF